MDILDIIKKYNLLTKKKFGQNFLVNKELLDKIVNVAGNIENSNILEIGPGPGGLTYSILEKNPKKLLSIEIDSDCFNILKNEFSNYKNFEVINTDALKINEKDFFNSEKVDVIANLPYNIGTALLIKWLSNLSMFNSFTLLLQKEVVDRIVANPCCKDYGRLSIIVQTFCEVKKAFDIKPTAFLPPPKVMSSVIHIVPKKEIIDVDFNKLSKITFLLFNQRRKKIRKVIQSLVENKKLDKIILKSINLDKRAEELSVTEFIFISNNFFD